MPPRVLFALASLVVLWTGCQEPFESIPEPQEAIGDLGTPVAPVKSDPRFEAEGGPLEWALALGRFTGEFDKTVEMFTIALQVYGCGTARDCHADHDPELCVPVDVGGVGTSPSANGETCDLAATRCEGEATVSGIAQVSEHAVDGCAELAAMTSRDLRLADYAITSPLGYVVAGHGSHRRAQATDDYRPSETWEADVAIRLDQSNIYAPDWILSGTTTSIQASGGNMALAAAYADEPEPSGQAHASGTARAFGGQWTAAWDIRWSPYSALITHNGVDEYIAVCTKMPTSGFVRVEVHGVGGAVVETHLLEFEPAPNSIFRCECPRYTVTGAGGEVVTAWIACNALPFPGELLLPDGP